MKFKNSPTVTSLISLGEMVSATTTYVKAEFKQISSSCPYRQFVGQYNAIYCERLVKSDSPTCLCEFSACPFLNAVKQK